MHAITFDGQRRINAGMDQAAKRACLWASGATRLPRSREGERALDILLMPLMDERIRREVMIRKALRTEDWVEAARLAVGRSERQLVAARLDEALLAGESELAARLAARLELLEATRADPTQDEGSYQRDLDADEWYLQDRRDSMGL